MKKGNKRCWKVNAKEKNEIISERFVGAQKILYNRIDYVIIH
jgi:hypothetical protein